MLEKDEGFEISLSKVWDLGLERLSVGFFKVVGI